MLIVMLECRHPEMLIPSEVMNFLVNLLIHETNENNNFMKYFLEISLGRNVKKTFFLKIQFFFNLFALIVCS